MARSLQQDLYAMSCTRAPWEVPWQDFWQNLKKSSVGKWAQNADTHTHTHFVRGCAVEMHLDIWQEPLQKKFQRTSKCGGFWFCHFMPLHATSSGVPLRVAYATSSGVPLLVAYATSSGVPLRVAYATSSGVPLRVAYATSSGVPLRVAYATSSGVPLRVAYATSSGVPLRVACWLCSLRVPSGEVPIVVVVVVVVVVV